MTLSEEEKVAERRMTVLVWMLENGSNYDRDIRRHTKTTRRHFQPLLAELEAEGLVSHEDLPSGKEATRAIYSLTDAGKQLALRLRLKMLGGR